jgi:non-heme chloroperoxidase
MFERIQGSRPVGGSLVAMSLGMTILLVAGVFFVDTSAGKNQKKLHKVRVNGVELQYVDRGSGDPVIFVHGGLADYRMWEAQLEPFAQHYRVIAYSRRYNFPNNNPDIRPEHSPIVDADDLAALITRLKLGPVHVIGASSGAAAALFLAVRRPELVRSLVLAEPPVNRWVNDIPGGPLVFDEFMHNLWEPAGQAFRDGDPEQALRISIDYFAGPGVWEQLPEEVRTMIRDNQHEWQAATTSSDFFPPLSRDDVARSAKPMLMLTGGQTLAIHQLVNAELEWLRPNDQRVHIPDATHELWGEFPELCRETTLAFLGRH